MLAQRYHVPPHHVLEYPAWVFRHARLMQMIESVQVPPETYPQSPGVAANELVAAEEWE